MVDGEADKGLLFAKDISILKYRIFILCFGRFLFIKCLGVFSVCIN